MVKVTKRVVVSFFIRKYSYEFICNIMLMKTIYLLLERQWLYDRKMTVKGMKNRYLFVFKGEDFTLAPILSPKLMKTK